MRVFLVWSESFQLPPPPISHVPIFFTSENLYSIIFVLPIRQLSPIFELKVVSNEGIKIPSILFELQVVSSLVFSFDFRRKISRVNNSARPFTPGKCYNSEV